ncbi:Trafficking protein particle complex 8 [Gaertneriomyces sp. JEL0708]|nr:Trafficking protein particle complex 8 [Gaertneriomyces sp. JEL0708]
MSSGKAFINRSLCPLVGVASSPYADAIARLNGLSSFTELIRPFGTKIGQVQVQDAQHHPILLDSFCVRVSDVRHLDLYDERTINKAADHHLSQFGHGQPKLPKIKNASDVEALSNHDLTPWYNSYRKLVCDAQGISEHETFNHPTAYIIAVSTANNDPLATAQQLVSDVAAITTARPYLDPTVPQYFVLAHDPHVAQSVDVEGIFNRMRQTLPNCHLLIVNAVPHSSVNNDLLGSPEPPPNPTVPDVWSEYQQESEVLDKFAASASSGSSTSLTSVRSGTSTPVTDEGFPVFQGSSHAQQLVDIPGADTKDSRLQRPTANYGCYLSEEDFVNLANWLKELVTMHLVKHMQSCIQQWNEQVASNRRGLTGRLNRLVGMKYFGGSSKSPTATQPAVIDRNGLAIYPYNSPELIMRRLADYAFMLADYRLAYGTYDSVRKDFQGNEKSLKYLGGTQEMLAVCMLMSDGIGRGSLEGHFDVAISAYRDTKSLPYAARATVLCYEMLKQRGLFHEAAPLLIRMTGEDSDVRSALFLEQTAVCYLRIYPPMIRKYAFHLILAGHRYSKAGHRAHAYRCYLAALDVYEDKDWSLVEDHVHFFLGRQCAYLGQFEEAVHFFLRLLRDSRQSASQHNAYLRELVHLYRQYVSVHPEKANEVLSLPIPHITAADVPVSVTESVNTSATRIEMDDAWERMENELWEEGYRGKARRQVIGGKMKVAVGEPVFVNFTARNPMKVAIQMNDIYLRCSYSDTTTSDTGPTQSVSADFDVAAVAEAVMDAGESKKIQLRLIPKREGDISIRGVHFTLGGVIPSYQEFGDHQQDFTITVTNPMPVLDVDLRNFPETMLAGEVREVDIILKNTGNRGLKNAWMKCSLPGFVCLAVNDSLNSPNKALEETTLTVSNKLSVPASISIELPQVDEGARRMNAGESTSLRVFVRAEKAGKLAARFLFGYQSHDGAEMATYRSARHLFNINVLPSLRVHAITRPSGVKLDEFILGLELENLQTDRNIYIDEITTMSHGWLLKPIEEADAEEKAVLAPRLTTTKYFRFERVRDDSDDFVSPEMITMRAIEGLLLGDEHQTFRPPDLTMRLSNIALYGKSHRCLSAQFRAMSTASRMQHRISQLSSQYPALTPSQLKDVFTLYFTDDVDISILWSADDGPRRIQGDHHIMHINLGLQGPLQGMQVGLEPLAKLAKERAGKALFAETVREKRALISSLLKNTGAGTPVRVIVTGTDGIWAEGPCLLPVTIAICNTSGANRVKYSLSLDGSDVGTSTNAPSTPFHWIGTTRSKGSLGPEEETTITFMACFARRGVYNINRWTMNAELEPVTGNDPLHRKVPAASYATIVQTPSVPVWVNIQ